MISLPGGTFVLTRADPIQPECRGRGMLCNVLLPERNEHVYGGCTVPVQAEASRTPAVRGYEGVWGCRSLIRLEYDPVVADSGLTV